jgi:tellurium resistance protein TerD
MGMVRNAYIRLVNGSNDAELVRYEMTSDLEDKMETGAIVGSLNREGPKWHFTPLAEFADNGLKEIAEKHGMIIVQQ